MISPIFTTVVIGFLAIMIYMKATTNRFNTGDEELIEREARANSVRKKSLDELEYITIPFERLPFAELRHTEASNTDGTADSGQSGSNTSGYVSSFSCNPDEILRQDENEVIKLKGKKIVNFTGVSNTDLKTAYGAPNLTMLTEYDQNFTSLKKALDTWGSHLIEHGQKGDARRVLEFAVECRTDLKSTYVNLADIYAEGFEFDKIDHLIEVSDGLDSLMKGPIIRALKEKCDINKYVETK